MRDPRIQKLAKQIVHYSVSLQKGEKLLIENTGLQQELVSALIEEAYKAEASPLVSLKDPKVFRSLLYQANEEQLHIWAEHEASLMKQMDAYIAIRSGDNISELADVPSENMKQYNQIVGQKVHRDWRVPRTKWCVLRYPNDSMAQLANMSTEAFEDFYFNVCTLDYDYMNKAMDTLANRMEKTDRVHIKGPNTDLSFSIKDIPVVKCAGNLNIPDGEVYTAPVRDSVNGTLRYNTPSPYNGYTFEDVELTFKDGKIIEASANDTERINEIFNTDEGARYIGEFAIGLNPYIQHPMKDILFDEKIDGSFHFTPGQSYETAPNGNHSAIHWDMVSIQRPEYGGGEIYFDNVLIRKNGRFVTPDLEKLNPEYLKNS
ncbi:aminopeptidase [Pontibacillus yanchengensis]|uniref:Aminopeptidase n=2 Tax=Pontibacillus yanchengensis TaxID=462910 RepID=A0ACC7VGD5_9BACI|nr:aminopeptidase [Pontibacillus yanchengensis]MYL34082.1 aminopeptidase [Pontibacillus yanchengensis]MYL53170.1 aminopeptidase [Pontibacillus yanchengensis]